MKTIKLHYLLFVFFITFSSVAQHLTFETDALVTTKHQLTIRGQRIVYEANAGMQPVWDADGKVIASLFYTYYKRTDVKSAETRPLVFSFNGGPGSASVWMQIAYTGPKLLQMDDEGYPIQPYGIKDNPYSILDVADIVFVNPVQTAFSRFVETDGKAVDKTKFFGIKADATYLAQWMTHFVNRTNRWNSPKFLIGESYGGARVMALANELQQKHWMYLNGVIMVSPADYQVYRTGGPVDLSLHVPYFTATAWYHQKLHPDYQKLTLEEVIQLSEKFAIDELLPSIAKGSSLPLSEKNKIISTYAKLTGLSEEVVKQYHLQVPTSFFWKELLRQEQKTIGRLDSRYKGIDKFEAGVSPDTNIELNAWLHAFTPAINYYLREVLNFKTDLRYLMFGDVQPWDFQANDTREELRKAMAQNPYLEVLVQSGYYDGATTYFQGKYTLNHIDPSGKMNARLHFKGYKSGHMMYLRKEDLIKSTDDLRVFIKNTVKEGVPAKFD